MIPQRDMKAHLEWYVLRHTVVLQALLKEQPRLGVTADIMATDIVSGELMWAEVESGRRPAEEVVWCVGSYARLEWAMRHCSDKFVLENLPKLWAGSDPDDTQPEYLALWRRAFERNGRKVVCDERPLPALYRYHLYRGQERSEPQGISWTLDRDIACKFACGAGVRRPLEDPVILERFAHPDLVLAYLTGRGENEVIIDMEVSK
ncbi:MAG: hypothetical protein MOB07_31440 [Acidobacteria bacterium]|nr:hypothetical protein [Acidobacteriota bacterium]